MSIQHVSIINGQISIGYYYGGSDPRQWSPGIDYQLYLHGVPVTGEYRGYAWVGNGQVNIDRGTTIEQLTMDGPVPESVERYAGWHHAMKQKRMRASDKWTSDFYRGWRKAWDKRKMAGV